MTEGNLDYARLIAAMGRDEDEASERYAAMARYLRRFFGSGGRRDASDLAQTAMTRGIGRIAGGTPVRGPNAGGLFYGIARMMMRERRSRTQVPLPEGFDRGEVRGFLGMNPAETKRFVAELLARLEKDDREFFVGYAFGQRDFPGMSPEATRLRYFRIRKKVFAWANEERVTKS